MVNAPPPQKCAILLVKQLALKAAIRALNILYDTNPVGRHRIDQTFINNHFMYRVNGQIVPDAVPDLGPIEHVEWTRISNQITELFGFIIWFLSK